MKLKQMKHSVIIFTLILLFFFHGYAEGSYYLSRRISAQDGLLSSDVYCILQDDDGFIWIGTRGGLCRFDGYNFYHFTQTGKQSGLPKVEGIGAMRLSKDHHQLLLRTITHHQVIYDLRSSRFVHYDMKELPREKQTGRRLVAMYPDYRFETDQEGHLFVIGHKGKTKTLQLVRNTGLSSTRFNKYSISRNSKGLFFIATYGNGLFSYDPVKGDLLHYLAEDKNPFFYSNFLTCIFVDHSDNIWLGNEDAGITLASDMSRFTVQYIYPESSAKLESSLYVRAVYEAKNGHILIGVMNGNLFDYDPVSEHCTLLNRTGSLIYNILQDASHTYIATISGLFIDGVYYGTKSKDHYIPFDWFTDIQIDRYGRIWAATFNGGLMLFTWDKGRLTSRQFLNKSINIARMHNLQMSENRWLWMATNDGIFCVDTWNKHVTESHFKRYGTENSNLPGNEIITIYYSHTGKLYAGVVGKGLCVMDCKGDRVSIERLINTTNGLSVNTIRSINEDRYGNLWVAQESGIVRINQKRDIVANYDFSQTTLGNMFTENASCKGPKGELYFGTMKGLLKISGDVTDVNHKKILITDILVGGQSVYDKLNTISGQKQRVELPYDQNSITMSFSDFDYARISSCLYQYYMEGVDKDWHDGTILNKAEYNNLSPGHYIFHVRKMGDQKNETLFEIVICKPWFLSGWAWFFYILLMGSLTYWMTKNAREKFQLHQQLQFDRQLNEFRLNFFTHIAHEFRTPLSIIQTSIGKMKEDPSEKPRKKLVLTAAHGVQRLSKLINQLMEFRKVSTGNEHLVVSYGDIIAFAKNIYV
ncbi:MAG TPA: hypothetical protein DIS88_08945 [Prevotella sp.]|nr:hypothetical protein [Prevotella sp.]